MRRLGLFLLVVGPLGCVRSETRVVATPAPPTIQVARLPSTHFRARVSRVGPASREVVIERFSACVVVERRVTALRAETTASPRVAPIVGGIALVPYLFVPGAQAVGVFGAAWAGSGPLQVPPGLGLPRVACRPGRHVDVHAPGRGINVAITPARAPSRMPQESTGVSFRQPVWGGEGRLLRLLAEGRLPSCVPVVTDRRLATMRRMKRASPP